MGIFDKFKEDALDYFHNGSGWVRRMNISTKDIDVCEGEATADEKTNTCALCVALNRTVFKNHKKPEYIHPHCKCLQIPFNLTEPTLDFKKQKMDYLFAEKADWMRSMGYLVEDAEEVYDLIAENAKEQFMQGNYILGSLDRHGQRVNIVLQLPGKRHQQGKTYRVKTGWMAYPNGMLHNNTPIGGWAK